MNLTATTLEIEHAGELLILKPALDVAGVGESHTDAMAEELRGLIGHLDLNDVILDLHGTHPFTQTQRLYVGLWKAVRSNGGGIAICFI